MSKILVINAGSTSVKWRIVQADEVLGEGNYTHKKDGGADFSFEQGGETSTGFLGEVEIIPGHLLGVVSRLGVAEPVAVLHRIVHGGTEFREVTELTPSVLEKLRALEELAPLHQPVGLGFVEAVRELQPDWTNYGVFDTAFHATLEPTDYLYALPREVSTRLGIRRYGFHGISHGFVAHKIKELVPAAQQVVSVHLGGGTSVCGILGGESKYISMGLTPEEGLLMATRSGTLPVGVVLRLLRSGLEADEIERMVNRESGLLGLSGSSDIREVLAREDPEAQETLEMYVTTIAQAVVHAAVRLGGLDALVFTGTIGWKSPAVREKVLGKLSFLRVHTGAGELVETGVWRQRDPREIAVLALEAQEEVEMVRLYGARGVVDLLE